MALRIYGGLALRTLKPTLVSPCFAVPNTLNLQVRYAKRKGYRMAKARKKAETPKKIAQKALNLSKHLAALGRTEEPDKPDLPNDDVFIQNDFKYKKYSLVEAMNFHKEYHHPTVFNNPDAGIFVRMEFDMTKSKVTQFIKPFKDIAGITYPFSMGGKKDVLVFCGSEYVPEALESGAAVAGGADLVKKVKDGTVILNLYEHVLCHVDFLPELTPIRGLLKTCMPKARNGTATANLKATIPRFLYGIEYKCMVSDIAKDFGYVQCQIGTVEMDAEKVEENFKCVVESVMKFKPPKNGPFIMWTWCKSPPSPEEFAIDMSRYVRQEVEEIDSDASDDEGEPTEAQELKKLKQEASEV